MMKRGKTTPLNYSMQLGKRGSMIDEDKLILAKPFLKLNKKESMITKHEK
jgi:hypothetical protein